LVYPYLELPRTFEQEDNMEQRKRKSGGGKLARSETVTVRLDPKLRYLAELAARKQRRTISSFIEWAVEDSLKNVTLHESAGQDDRSVSVADESRLWDIDEAERFARIAIQYPELLTYEEQKLWKAVWDSGLLTGARCWSDEYGGGAFWDWSFLERVTFPLLRQYWKELKEASESEDAACSAWIKKMRMFKPWLESYPQDKFEKNLPKWKEIISSGRQTAENVINMVESRWALTDAQKEALRNVHVGGNGHV
jgi:hypothetical protein